MIIALALCLLALANLVLTAVLFRWLHIRLRLLQDDVSWLRIQMTPFNVGGRVPPSVVELERARNRMDRLGVAHPGGPG